MAIWLKAAAEAADTPLESRPIRPPMKIFAISSGSTSAV